MEVFETTVRPRDDFMVAFAIRRFAKIDHVGTGSRY
jgi:hypothetical protein